MPIQTSAFNLIFLSAEPPTDNNRDVTDSENLLDTNMEAGKQQETVETNFDLKIKKHIDPFMFLFPRVRISS